MNAANDSTKGFTAWLAALFLAVLGAKLWIVQLYASPLPWWDDWYETASLFKNWLAGLLTWKDFFAPYCEHRILFTRLLDLGLLILNRRWDPLLQMVASAVIHTAYVCGLAFCLWDFLGRKNGWLVCLLLLPFFALPYAAENAIWAFNSQAYFLAFFFLPAIAGLGFGKMLGGWWWFGLVAAVLGLFTMASGLLAPATVAGLTILRTIRARRIEKQNVITLGASLAVVTLGTLLYVQYAGDAALRAHNFSEFAAAFTRNVTWPFINAPGMALFIALPLLALFVLYFRAGFAPARAAEFLLALGLWSVLQSVALAYGRGNFGEAVPASRYMDKLNVLVIASVFATVLLGKHWWRGEASKKFTLLFTLIFSVVIFFGLGRISKIVVNSLLVPTRTMTLIAEERVETFMATGDERELMEQPTVRPDPKVTLGVLRDAQLQTILPASCQPPATAHVTGRFSSTVRWLLRHATWFLYAGLILFIGLLGLALARDPAGLAWKNVPAFIAGLALLAALGFVWTKEPIRRETIERELQCQLIDYFKANNNPIRAAIHERKAEALTDQVINAAKR
jgi:hypothetical protein